MILVCNISYKNLIAAKPLCVSFNKQDDFIRVFNKTRYLVLFGIKKYDFIYKVLIIPRKGEDYKA